MEEGGAEEDHQDEPRSIDEEGMRVLGMMVLKQMMMLIVKKRKKRMMKALKELMMVLKKMVGNHYYCCCCYYYWSENLGENESIRDSENCYCYENYYNQDSDWDIVGRVELDRHERWVSPKECS